MIFDLASIGIYYYFLRQSLVRYYFQDWFIFLLFFCVILFTFGKTDKFYFSLIELGILTLSVLIPVLFVSSYGQKDSKYLMKKKFRHIKSDGPLSPEDLFYSPNANTLGINSQRYSKIEQKTNFFNMKLQVQAEDKLSNRFFLPNTPKSPFTNGVIHSGRESSQNGMPKHYSQMNLSSSAEGSNNCLSLHSRAYFNSDFEAKRELEKKIIDFYEGEEVAMNPCSHLAPKSRKDAGKPSQLNSGVVKSQDNQINNNILLMQNSRQRYHSTGNNFKTLLNVQQQIFPERIATTATTLNHQNNNNNNNFNTYHPQQHEQSLTVFQDRNVEEEVQQRNKGFKETVSSRPSMQINGKPLDNDYQVEDISQQKNHFLLNGDLSIIEGEDIFPSILLDEDCSIIGFAGNIFECMIPNEINKSQYQQSQQQRFQNRQYAAKFEQMKRKNSVTHEKQDKNDQKSMKNTESPENKSIYSSTNVIQELQRLLDTTYVSLFEFFEASKKHELIQIFLKHDSQSMQLNSIKQKNVIHPSFVPSVANFLENKSHGASPVNSNNINSFSQEDSQAQLSSRGIITQFPKGTAQLLFGSPALVSYHKAAMTMLSGNPFLVLNTSQNSFSMLRPEDQVPSTQQQVPEPPLSLVKKIPSSLNMMLPNSSLARLENSPRATAHSPRNTIQTLMSIPSDLAEQHQQQQDSTRNRQNTHQKTQNFSNTPPHKPFPPRRQTQNSLSKICSIQPITLNNLNGIQIMTHNPTASQAINSSSINNNYNSNSFPQPSVSSLRIENNIGKIQDEFVNYIFQFEKACNASNLRVIISIILDLEKENLTEQVVYRVLQCKNFPVVPKCPSCANQGGSLLNVNPGNHKTSTNNRFLNVTPSNRKLSEQAQAHHLSWNMENIAIDIVINPRNSLAVPEKTTTRKEKVRVIFRRDFSANFFESVHTMHSSQEEQNKNKAEVLLVKKIFIDSFQSVSHEFGTALNCINNLSDAACSQLSQQSVTTIIKPIRYNSTLIQFLVNDILDHHMILQNTFLLDDQPFSLSALRSELIELFYLQVEYKHLKLEIRVNQNIPDLICADRNRIQSILMTMIRNAIKYTQSGGITVEIKSKHNTQLNISHSSNFMLIVEVSDTGVGLDEYESNRLRQLLNYGFCNEPISKNSLGNGVGGLCVSNLIAIRLSGKINRGISFMKNPCANNNHGTIFSFQVFCTQSLSQKNGYFPNIKTNPSAVIIPIDLSYQGNLDKTAYNDWEIASGLVSPTPDMANKQETLINHVYSSQLIRSMQAIERDQEKKGRMALNPSFSEKEEQIQSKEQVTLKSREKLEFFVTDYSQQTQKVNRERSVSLQERVHSNPQQDKQLNPLEELNEQDDEEQEENNFNVNQQKQTDLQQHTFIQQLVFEKQISLPTKTKIQDISGLGVSLPAQLTTNPSHWSTHAAAQSVFIQNLSSTTPSSQNNSNSLIPIPLSSQRQYQIQQQSTSAALAKSQRFENIQDEDFQVENLMTNLNFFREQGLRESQETDNSMSTNKNNFSLNSPKVQSTGQALSPLLNFGGSKKSLFNHIRTSKNRLTFDSYSFQQLQQAHNLQRTHSNTVNLPSRARNNSSVLVQSTQGFAAVAEKNQKIANILSIPDRTKRTSDPVGNSKSQVTESIVITDGINQKKIFEPKESNRVIRSFRPLPLLDTNFALAESPTASPNFNLVGYGSSLGPQKYMDAFQFSLKEKDSVLNDNLHSPNRRLSNKSFMNRRSRVTFGGGNPPSLDEEPLKLDKLISKSLESLHSEASSDQEYPNKTEDINERGIILKVLNPHESVRHQVDVQNTKFQIYKQETFNIESNKKIEADKNTLQTLATDKISENLLQDPTQIFIDNRSNNNNDKKSQLEITIPDEHHDHDPQFEGLYSVPKLEKQSTSSGLSSQCCVKILCVDDEPFNHFVMKAILAPKKLLFDTALDGKQAVTMFQQRKKCQQCGLSSYSLIFMDLNMPVKNGFEATIEIKNLIQLNHTTSKVMIVICSAFIDIASKSKAQQCGSDYFLQKPINSKHLFEFIETHFQI